MELSVIFEGDGATPNAARQSFTTGERILDVRRSAHFPLCATITASNVSPAATQPSLLLRTPPFGGTQTSLRTSRPAERCKGSAPRPSSAEPTNLPSHGRSAPASTHSSTKASKLAERPLRSTNCAAWSTAPGNRVSAARRDEQRPPTPRLPVSKTTQAMPHCTSRRAAARPDTPPPITPTRIFSLGRGCAVPTRRARTVRRSGRGGCHGRSAVRATIVGASRCRCVHASGLERRWLKCSTRELRGR
mmetsp:Transcript_31386/g.94172  ORF Transcript_31386/g.94172 Transcript_31386/m.94172 type:complete len:247 (+) Transcript_31386:556-1296(+)